MNSTAAALAAAVTFVWLGMVLAISFLEAPLKFRAPGVTVRVGLGIGRLVFRALNLIETVLVSAVIVAVAAGGAAPAVTVPAVAAAAILMVQLTTIRPWLKRRSDRVLAGEDHPRSRGHLAYVALEIIKVIVLVLLGSRLLTV